MEGKGTCIAVRGRTCELRRAEGRHCARDAKCLHSNIRNRVAIKSCRRGGSQKKGRYGPRRRIEPLKHKTTSHTRIYDGNITAHLEHRGDDYGFFSLEVVGHAQVLICCLDISGNTCGEDVWFFIAKASQS